MASRLTLLVLLAAVAGSGCATTGPARLDRRALVGTEWIELCPGQDIRTAFVRLDADGHLAWSYDSPEALVVEDVHTWAVADGALELRWNHASATSRFTATADPDELAGTAAYCPDALVLERLAR